MKKFPILLVILILCLLFFLSAIVLLDPDFGWHLKNGEIFLKSGIFYTDPYSYTMPSFPVVSHEWASEVFIAFFYNLIGIFGLAIIISVVFLISFMLFFLYGIKSVAKKEKNFLINVFSAITLLAISSVFPFFSIRPQEFAWLLWTIFILIVFDEKNFQKYKLILPLLFLVWANIHGSFAIGIFTFVFIFLFRIFRRMKVNTEELFVCVFCISATLVNPFGLSLWREVFDTFSSSLLRFNIAEWSPAISSVNWAWITFLAISLAVVWKNRKIFRLEEVILYFLFLVNAVISIKNIPFWVFFSLFFVFKGIYLFYSELPSGNQSRMRFAKASKYLFLISIFIFAVSMFFSFFGERFSENSYYPQKAVLYLKENKPKAQIFSQYSWGGYLIWKYPEKKVFIDGRMAIWHRSGTNSQETNNAFDDYLKITSGEKDFKEIFQKYNIDTVLWPREKEVSESKKRFKNFEREICTKLAKFGCKPTPTKTFLERIKEAGWHEVYQDNVAVVYKSPS